MNIKRSILNVARSSGLFALSSRFHGDRLGILCYHGFAVEDECEFRPQLFISPQKFAARLELLQRLRFNVLPLSEALQRLDAGTLPARSLAITIDDGFASTCTVAAPLLQHHSMPATVYVTTYYVEKGTPVFRLAVQYLYWKTARSANPAALGPMWPLIARGERMGTEEERTGLLEEVAAAAGESLASLRSSGKLSLMSAVQLAQLAKQGLDVQLHTHRHRFPLDDEHTAHREIEENRASIARLTGTVANHFCYPSGLFGRSQWPWLQAAGVLSATTCEPGLNSAATPRLGLLRFLDSEAIANIEFHSEVMGFNEVLRGVRRRVLRQRPGMGHGQGAGRD